MVRNVFKSCVGQDVEVRGVVKQPGRKVRGGQRCIVDVEVFQNGQKVGVEDHVNVFSDSFAVPRVYRDWQSVPEGSVVVFEGEVEQYRRVKGSYDYGVSCIRSFVVE